jgi:hypothetical protein
MSSSAAQALEQFGFTALEAEVYAQLLIVAPATGYKVAQAIKKPAANTYKALESLERKGAVVASGSSTKSYQPVNPETLFDRLAKEFDRNRKSALKSFASLGKKGVSGPVAVLSTFDQAVGAAHEVIERAKSTLVVIATSDYLDSIAEELRATPAKVWLMTTGSYKGEIAEKCQLPEDAFDHPTLQIVADGSAVAVASGSESEFFGYSATNHPVATSTHSAIVCQIGLYLVDRKLEEDAGRKQIAKVIENLP